MAESRLTGADKRALVVWVLAGIVGVVFAYKYFHSAFPEASVEFRVSREEALARAQKFVGGLGENVSGYEKAIVFEVDDNAKTYLERQLGLKQANELMAGELNLWNWEVRFFRPKQQEEFHVSVSPRGEIVGYEHTIEEARAGAELERAAAQERAQKFLSERLGMTLAAWDFLPEESSSKKLPNRMHWEFTWEKHGFKAKDAPYRLRVAVDGDRVNGSHEFLKVPEEWERGYRTLRSSNDTLTLVFLLPYLAMLGFAVGLTFILSRKSQANWALALKIGALVALLLFLRDLNEWPLWASSYNTTDAYGAFLAQKIAASLLVALITAVLTVAAIIPAAETLYRVSQPERMQLRKAFAAKGMRTKEFFSASVVGISLAAVHVGYLTAFYIVAGRLGAWAPQEVQYENSISTAFPWISGAAIGVTAATSEEFLFRMFAIPFLKRVTGSRWVAVIVPAFLWSFLHSNYPQEPAYVRGIEIGIMGILAGIVMLRWGIVATLVWHYTVDAFLVGLLLIRSTSPYLQVSGVVVGLAAFLPLAYCAVSYLRRGTFEEDEALRNNADPEPDVSYTLPVAEGVAPAKVRQYDALRAGKMALLAACLILGALAAWKVKTEQLGDYLKVSVNAREAKERADEVLRGRGVNAANYRTATVFVNVTDAYANEFLRQRIGLTGLNEIYGGAVPGALWRVRYFQDQQAEEYAVILKPDGSLHSVHHTLAEKTEGASLSNDEAVARAEKFLREEKKLDSAAWSLVEATPEKQPRRIDYHLTWQQKTPLDGASAGGADAGNHAYARFDVDILGNEPANYRTYVKIPEDWERKHDESTLGRKMITWGVPILLYAGLGITALVVLLMNLRSEAARAVSWKRVSLWGAAALVAFVGSFTMGSAIPIFLNAYRTDIPFKAMLLGMAIGVIVGGAFTACGYAALYGTTWYFGNKAFGEERIPAGGKLPGAYYRDALWIGVCGSAALIGLSRLMAAVSAHWPTLHRSFPGTFGLGMDAWIPGGAIAGAALTSSLLNVGVIVFVVAFAAAQIKPMWARLLLFVLGAVALTASNWGDGADLGKQVAAEGILLAVIVLGASKVARFNVLGCLLAAGLTALLGGASRLLEQPNGFYRMNGYAVLVVMVLVLAWPLAMWKMGAADLRGEERSSSTG